MLQDLSASRFEECLDQPFKLTVDDSALELRLFEVEGHPDDSAVEPSQGRQPFSLLFRGPETPVLLQSIYSLEHEQLGRLEIFLVPIGPDADGMRYEAVFS